MTITSQGAPLLQERSALWRNSSILISANSKRFFIKGTTISVSSPNSKMAHPLILMSVSDLVLELVEGGDLLEYILKYNGVRECLPRFVRCSPTKHFKYSRGGFEAYCISALRCTRGKGLLLLCY